MVARHYTACVRSLVQTIHAVPSAVIKDSPRRTLSTTRLVVRHPPQTRSRYSIQRSEQQRDPVIPCSDSDVIDYFRRLLPPLEFPHDVALRMITHSSWRDGVQGHNTRQSFIGRRVLHAYLMTFLHAHTTLTPTPPLTKPPTQPTQDLKISGLPAPDPTLDQDYDKLVQRILHTRALGDHVGGAWALERVMRWVPNTNDPSPNQEGASSGFHKIRGTTVEAVVGGVFHQFGGVAAHRLFHTRLLPHVSFLLPTEYRKPAQEACDFLGGPAAPLLPRSQQVPHKAAAASG